MSAYRRFVPYVPDVVPDSAAIGNNNLQVVEGAVVPYVPYVPYKKKIRDIEDKKDTHAHSVDSAYVCVSLPDDYSTSSTFFSIGNIGNKLENTLEKRVPYEQKNREQNQEHREQNREHPVTIRTFATFADAWAHWVEIGPTIPAGLWRDDTDNAPGLWRDTNTGLFMVRGTYEL